ncbi:MAG: amylo-alpha-1,6-glucosidase [Candidatus Micrarchaeia archaeon]
MQIVYPGHATEGALFGIEWLASGFAGSYSSTTAPGANTRKYHGVLAAPDPSGLPKRWLILQKLDERITPPEGAALELDTNFYPGAVYPQGYKSLQKISMGAHAIRFSYSTRLGKIEKEIRMVEGGMAAKVSYSFDLQAESRIELIPKFNHRQIHSIGGACRQECDFHTYGFGTKNGLLDMLSPDMRFSPKEETFRSCTYPLERERGYEFSEDLYSPGVFMEYAKSGRFSIYARAFYRDTAAHNNDGKAYAQAMAGKGAGLKKGNGKPPGALAWESKSPDWFAAGLEESCAKFITAMPNGQVTALAGYPWFYEWSRDAMVFIDGALLPFGRMGIAREILIHFASMQENGLAPNTRDYGRGGDRAGSVDSTLWLMYEALLYMRKSNDPRFAQMLCPHIMQGIGAYLKGNDGFGADAKDLLVETRQGGLTWMDARDAAGAAFTPRIGKPVEVNALWHNCLALAAGCQWMKPEERANFSAMADETGRQMGKFYDRERACLKDVLGKAEFEMRPNQAIALGLEINPFGREETANSIEAVEKELLTPYGLLSLSRQGKGFIGIYRGGQQERDRAYHNGAIWPYLLGFHFSAKKNAGIICKKRKIGMDGCYSVEEFQKKFDIVPVPGSQQWRHDGGLEFFNPLKKSIGSYGAGHVPELYEPDTRMPAGSPFQAWSDAQVLKAYSICLGTI